MTRNFGLGEKGPETLDKLGDEMGISGERAGQLKRRGIEGLRRHYGLDGATEDVQGGTATPLLV